jgi:hypothetical protein
MAWEPAQASPKNLRQVYHWAFRQFIKVGKRLELAGTGGSSDHNTLSGVTADQHHNQRHAFGGADHTGLAVAGALDGQVLTRRTGAWRNEDLPIQSWFDSKPAGEPIGLLFSGQSNAGGSSDQHPSLVKNDNVYEYSTGGTGAPLSWISPDPNGPAKGDYNPADLSGYTGMYLDKRGNIGWSAADYLQKITGRDVYLVTVWRNNAGIDEWLTGGDIYSRWQTDVAAAVATTELNNRDFDVFIWMQGEYDTAMAAATYLSKWEEMYDEAPGVADRFTQTMVCGPSPAFPGTETNLRNVCDTFHEYVRYGNSYKIDTTDGVHFNALGMELHGLMSAYKGLAGPL